MLLYQRALILTRLYHPKVSRDDSKRVLLCFIFVAYAVFRPGVSGALALRVFSVLFITFTNSY